MNSFVDYRDHTGCNPEKYFNRPWLKARACCWA